MKTTTFFGVAFSILFSTAVLAQDKSTSDNEVGQSVSVIDVISNAVVQTIALGFMPGSVAHNAFKNELWVTDPDNGKVHYWTLNAELIPGYMEMYFPPVSKLMPLLSVKTVKQPISPISWRKMFLLSTSQTIPK